MNYPKISVILVTYNSLIYLEECIKCLKEQTFNDIEIVIVDNASTDNTVDWIKENHSDIILVESKINLGYGAGNNKGVKHCSGDIILILNNDTSFEKNFIKNLVKPLLKDKNIAITTPVIAFYKNKKIINSFGNEIHLSGIVTCSYLGKNINKIKNNKYLISTSGCAFMMYKDLFFRLKGFDENYWLSLEDTDLSWRIRTLNKKILGVYNSIIYHKYIPKFNKNKIFNIELGRYYFIIKNFPLRAIILLSPIFVFIEFIMCLYYLFFNKELLFSKFKAFYYLFKNLKIFFYERSKNKYFIKKKSYKWYISYLTTELDLSAAIKNKGLIISILNYFFSVYKKIIVHL